MRSEHMIYLSKISDICNVKGQIKIQHWILKAKTTIERSKDVDDIMKISLVSNINQNFFDCKFVEFVK